MSEIFRLSSKLFSNFVPEKLVYLRVKNPLHVPPVVCASSLRPSAPAERNLETETERATERETERQRARDAVVQFHLFRFEGGGAGREGEGGAAAVTDPPSSRKCQQALRNTEKIGYTLGEDEEPLTRKMVAAAERSPEEERMRMEEVSCAVRLRACCAMPGDDRGARRCEQKEV
eukprot:2895748-Rhodomonas_salina.1